MSTSSLRDRAAGGDQPGQQLTARQERELVQRQATDSMAALIRTMTPEIQRALPGHLSGERMARIAMTQLRSNPQLALATRESFLGALLTAAQLGLEFGPSAEAYLVPYEHRRGPLAGKVEAQLIVGYQGLAKLFFQHPLARHLDAQAVYEADEFEYEYGLSPSLRHKPARGGRGQVVCYYAVGSLTTGASHFVVLSPEEVRELRSGKVGPSGNIADPQRWMERKTALRQLLKSLPKSTTLVQALAADGSVRTDTSATALDAPMVYPAVAAADEAPVDVTALEVEQPPAAVPPAAPATDDPMTAGAEAQRAEPSDVRRLNIAVRTVPGLASAKDRDARLAFVAEIVGHPVESTNHLTREEVGMVLADPRVVAARTAVPVEDLPPPPSHEDLGEPADPHWQERDR